MDQIQREAEDLLRTVWEGVEMIVAKGSQVAPVIFNLSLGKGAEGRHLVAAEFFEVSARGDENMIAAHGVLSVILGRADATLFIAESWALDPSSLAEGEEMPESFADHPARYEVMVVRVATPTADGVAVARINREMRSVPLPAIEWRPARNSAAALVPASALN